jgi:hypothetical protein
MIIKNHKSVNQIQHTQSDGIIEIKIFPVISPAQINIIRVWLGIWTFSGLIIMTQFFTNAPRETKMFLALWMTFWGYFEFKVYNILWWKKNGCEVIKVDNEQLEIILQSSNKPRSFTFENSSIKNLSTVDFNEKKYGEGVNSSFFGLGKETIYFEFNQNKYGIGKQLNREEANRVLKLLKSKIKT